MSEFSEAREVAYEVSAEFMETSWGWRMIIESPDNLIELNGNTEESGKGWWDRDGRFDMHIGLRGAGKDIQITHLEKHFEKPLQPTSVELTLFELEFGQKYPLPSVDGTEKV